MAVLALTRSSICSAGLVLPSEEHPSPLNQALKRQALVLAAWELLLWTVVGEDSKLIKVSGAPSFFLGFSSPHPKMDFLVTYVIFISRSSHDRDF